MNSTTTQLSKVFKGIGGVLVALGIIGGIAAGAIFQIPQVSLDSYSNTYSTRTEFNFPLMICVFISVAILCVLVFGIAFILEYLEDIKEQLKTVEHSEKTTSPFKNLNSSVSSFQVEPSDQSMPKITQPASDEWKCPNCERINKNYVGTCGCGHHK